MRKVTIPWGCWRGSKQLPLTFPNNWQIYMAAMDDAPDVSREEIRRAFQNPIGQEPIRRLAEGKKTAVIAVDDSGGTGAPLTDPNQLTEQHKLTYILHPMAGG